MGTEWARNGSKSELWDHFFEGFCPNVSSWLAVCSRGVHLARPKPQSFYYPNIQSKWAWPIRQWFNSDSPGKRTCEDTDTCDRFNESLYQTWRLKAHAVVSRVHKPNARYRALVDEVWTALNPSGASPVLGVHMRGSDKRSGRIKIGPAKFWPYVESFVQRFPNGRILVATESVPYANEVRDHWNHSESAQGRMLMQPMHTRVEGRRGNFYVHKQLAVAHEVFLDIQLLARCDYLLHGASAVAEAAIYTNPALHWRSTHLEYANNCNASTHCHDAPWKWRRRYSGSEYGDSARGAPHD